MTLAAPEARSPIRLGLTGLGVLAVAFFLVRDIAVEHDPWGAVGLVAVALWMALVVIGGETGRVVLVIATAAALLSGVSGATTQVLGIVPAIGVVIRVLARSTRPVRDGLLTLGAAAVGIGVGGLIAQPDPLAMLGSCAALAIATLSAISRRQFRQAEAQSRALLEERARSAASDERARIARDIHDVLAHSLGGLVLQLDAVDAELDAGETDAAHRRVRAARTLAADGLTEARAAVRALRAPDAAVDLPAALRRLLDEHVAFGSPSGASIDDGIELAPRTAAELELVTRELLVNARRHAPGAPTTVELRVDGASVVLVCSSANPQSVPAAPTGGGFGLRGVRERVAALGGTVDVDARDPFVVTVRVPR